MSIHSDVCRTGQSSSLSRVAYMNLQSVQLEAWCVTTQFEPQSICWLFWHFTLTVVTLTLWYYLRTAYGRGSPVFWVVIYKLVTLFNSSEYLCNILKSLSTLSSSKFWGVIQKLVSYFSSSKCWDIVWKRSLFPNEGCYLKLGYDGAIIFLTSYNYHPLF